MSKENEWVKTELEQLKEDTHSCLEEIRPILAKYNLEIAGAHKQFADNIVMATVKFVRPKQTKK